MRAYRQTVQDSWIRSVVSFKTLAATLNVQGPTTLSQLLNKLAIPETVDLKLPVVTADGIPLGGNVEMLVSSDGKYTFKGSMEASGFPSYKYGVQVFMKTGDGVVLAAFHSGEVYGTDTPGNRTDSWEESLYTKMLTDRWISVRKNTSLSFALHADISGLTGSLWDVVKLGLAGIAAYTLLGPEGLIIIIGSEMAAAAGLSSPGIIPGIVINQGLIYVFGPDIILLAIAAGVAAGAAIDSSFRHRALSDDERTFAKILFAGTLDSYLDRITVTNLSHDGGRKYTIPDEDGSILVNLNDAFDDPIHYTEANSDYTQPGSVFAHELTHACQIATATFLPGLICSGGDYSYHNGSAEADRLLPQNLGWAQLPWTGFKREQQAHIVDDWYGAFCGNFSSLDDLKNNLNTPQALSDPAFPFIVQLRAGIT